MSRHRSSPVRAGRSYCLGADSSSGFGGPVGYGEIYRFHGGAVRRRGGTSREVVVLCRVEGGEYAPTSGSREGAAVKRPRPGGLCVDAREGARKRTKRAGVSKCDLACLSHEGLPALAFRRRPYQPIEIPGSFCPDQDDAALKRTPVERAADVKGRAYRA